MLCASVFYTLSPQPSYFHSKQKTLLCLGKWTAHIPVKRHIEPCNAGEHSKKEKTEFSYKCISVSNIDSPTQYSPAGITA